MSAGAYKPVKPEHFERMTTLLRNAETKEQLKSMLMLYVLDLDYPRPDIVWAERVVKKEKGWGR